MDSIKRLQASLAASQQSAFLTGFASVGNLWGTALPISTAILTLWPEAKPDEENLRGDWYAVGNQLRDAIRVVGGVNGRQESSDAEAT